jgi:23S rRNA (uridine2552-2'-O)-methyltransferase
MNWWQKRQQVDPFVKQRKINNLLSRSYFKIEEIYKKYSIGGERVLELGAAPGGWTQYLISKSKSILAIDILPLHISSEKVQFIQQDIRSFASSQDFDVILSDIAPNISGNRVVDNAFMEEMVNIYILLSYSNLCVGGTLVFKSFQWECNDLLSNLYSNFKKIHIFKPKSSRSSSSEVYVVCTGLIARTISS